MKWEVTALALANKYIGTFEAETEEEAITQALNSADNLVPDCEHYTGLYLTQIIAQIAEEENP